MRRLSSAQAMSSSLEMLRERLRQQELLTADATELYRAKVREQHELLEKLVERDTEVQSLRMTITELADQLGKLELELEQRSSEFTRSLDLLMEEKVLGQNELIHVVAGKEKELQDTRVRLREALAGAGSRQAALESSLAGSQQEKASVERELLRRQDTIADREKTIERLRREVAELRRSLPPNGQAAPRLNTRSSTMRRLAERIQRLFQPTEPLPTSAPTRLPAGEPAPSVPRALGPAALRAPSRPASITDDMVEENTQILPRPNIGGHPGPRTALGDGSS